MKVENTRSNVYTNLSQTLKKIKELNKLANGTAGFKKTPQNRVKKKRKRKRKNCGNRSPFVTFPFEQRREHKYA